MTPMLDYLRRAKDIFDAFPLEEKATSKLAQSAWRRAQEQADNERTKTDDETHQRQG